MTHVWIFDIRVPVPEGYDYVAHGFVREGDRILDLAPSEKWYDAGPKEIGVSIHHCEVVIRREPGDGT